MKCVFPKGRAVWIISHEESLWSTLCCQWRKRDSPCISALLQIVITEIILTSVTGPLPLLHLCTKMLVKGWWFVTVSQFDRYIHPLSHCLFGIVWLDCLFFFFKHIGQLQGFLQNFHIVLFISLSAFSLQYHIAFNKVLIKLIQIHLN